MNNTVEEYNDYKIIKEYNEDKIYKKYVLSNGLNYVSSFRYTDGYSERRGKRYEDNPERCDFGMEIADIEISTICGMECLQCFVPDTKIITKDGIKKIQDINIGDNIITSSEGILHQNSAFIDKVEDVYQRDYAGKIINIELEDGKIIKVTPEHPIFVSRYGWKKAEDICEKDDVAIIEEYKKCKNCGKLIYHYSSYKRYYCSKGCYNEVALRECPICKQKKDLGGEHKVFCSDCVDFSGKSNHRLKKIYLSMMHRCYNKKRNNYYHYGERGIFVEKRWHTFDNFIKDMYPSFKEGLTLDRIDNSKGYSMKNCRWVTTEEQRINRRRFKNSKRKYKGVTRGSYRKYIASIRHKSETHYLGVFESEDDAGRAYNRKLKEFYPENWIYYANKIEDGILL